MKSLKIFIKILFKKIGSAFHFLSRSVYQTDQERRTILWYKNPEEKKVRFDFDINEDSVVFDVGGYEGQWASDIFGMYECSVYVFEPVSGFYNKIRERFLKNKKIKVFNFGLSGKTEQKYISVEGDMSSNHKDGAKEKIEIVGISDFIRDHSISSIDLIKINIEGDEYDLLESLIDSGNMNIIKNILVQFHDFVPDAVSRMNKIKKSMETTHKLVYGQEFVWERWINIK